MLPRYVRFSTAWSLCPFTVMLGSWCGFPGAGCYITSVFLVLMMRPKLSQAVENPSISSCISLLAFSAQSSAKRRSLITVSLTLVTACRRRGLNSFPSHLYLMGMPGEVSLKASVSIAKNIRLNSVGQGCSLLLLHWSLETGLRRFHHQALLTIDYCKKNKTFTCAEPILRFGTCKVRRMNSLGMALLYLGRLCCII